MYPARRQGGHRRVVRRRAQGDPRICLQTLPSISLSFHRFCVLSNAHAFFENTTTGVGQERQEGRVPAPLCQRRVPCGRLQPPHTPFAPTPHTRMLSSQSLSVQFDEMRDLNEEGELKAKIN